MRQSVLTLACVALVSLGALCARAPSPPPPEAHILERKPFVIGHEDILRVTVWKHDELGATVPVRPDGMISVPLVGDVQAAGLTAEELTELLTKQLSEYVTNPEVTVIVSEIRSKRVYIIGGVTRPGAQTLNQDMRVLDAISVGGGFTPFADRNGVRLIRRMEDGRTVEYRFHYGNYINGEAHDSNVLLKPGDTIVVPD